MRFPVRQVMDLHEIDGCSPHPLHRSFHLSNAFGQAGRPDFSGVKKVIGDVHIGGQVADDLLGSSVHGRCIDQSSACPV